MTDDLDRMRSLLRLQCLNRLAKLQAKLEDSNWNVQNELELLLQTHTGLILILHDLGIPCYVGEDIDIADRMDRKS